MQRSSTGKNPGNKVPYNYRELLQKTLSIVKQLETFVLFPL